MGLNSHPGSVEKGEVELVDTLLDEKQLFCKEAGSTIAKLRQT